MHRVFGCAIEDQKFSKGFVHRARSQAAQTRIAEVADAAQVGAVGEPAQGDPKFGMKAPRDGRARFAQVLSELAAEVFFEEFGALDRATHDLRYSRMMRSPMVRNSVSEYGR